MKTASVRDLRNRYSILLGWIGAGEEIIITQRGKTVARLVPEQKKTASEVNWSESPALKRNRSCSKVLSASDSKKIIREASGKW